MNPILTVELVPATSWCSNLRSELRRKDWDFLRKRQYKIANHRCELCGGVGRRHPVECHEIWAFDDESHIQTLTGLIALCPPCHEVKHIGLAAVRGNLVRALAHLSYINRWDVEDAGRYVEESFRIHAERSEHSWELNLDWLKQFQISAKTP